ncbi:hypothetical protein N7493_007089 [Penicillium malachiteum]|uniref:Xylanolytic transcriptional activator regulatory domain-containing protein n=1 Tax=Penicillium malachiteum TaxID=1324776 RepID=A0AAD6HIK7_9EURO|nr:hypothetical protein N7493_007089 [Penicillium malachiteum]
MASESPQIENTPPQTGPGDQATTPVADTAKRKAEQGNGTQTRAKRNRYISIAWYVWSDSRYITGVLVGINSCPKLLTQLNGICSILCHATRLFFPLRNGNMEIDWQWADNSLSFLAMNANVARSNAMDKCRANDAGTSIWNYQAVSLILVSYCSEFRSMTAQITTLQEQVNNLFSNINELRSQKSAFESPPFDHLSRDGSQSVFTPMPPGIPKARSRHPRFHGPTSSAFNFDVAKTSLQSMGITPAEDGIPDDLTTAHVTPAGSPPAHLGPLVPTIHPTKDPIWSIRREEALRLCKVYEEEIGIMYPLVDITTVTNQANLLYTFMEAATRTGFAQRGLPGADSLHDDNSILLKLILATTLVVEGGGESDIGQRLYHSIKPVIESKLWGPHDIRNIQLFAIVATYHFHTDDDAMAYRLIGLAARMCLEMGLHRRDALLKSFPSEDQWNEITRIFWTVYSLDRRWSLGTGLPFVIQDEDIDPNLPEPDSSLPYLRCMISYNRISSKIWYSGLGSEGTTDIRRDEIGYLDYQILQWYKQVPDELKFYPVESPKNGEAASRGMRRLRVLLYLRMNQLRILIYRPVLHSAASILEDRSHAQTVVDIAKDTVRVLTRLNQMSDIYRTQQITFNYFLVAALAVLFLAVCHAPSDFNRQVREEFYMALNLINGFSTKSYVSKRLWKTIKGLRKIGEKLGVLARPFGTDSTDPHSTAAVAMAGLAGHSIDDLAVYGSMNGVDDLGNSPLNGLQMSNELTHLFEAVGSFGNFLPSTTGPDGMNGFVGADGEIQNTGEGLSGILGGDEEFSRIIRDLF